MLDTALQLAVILGSLRFASVLFRRHLLNYRRFDRTRKGLPSSGKSTP
jgi:hypothetical protein